VHGQLETPLIPALVLVPWLTGALHDRQARKYFVSFFAIAYAHFMLTDYNADEPQRNDSRQRNPILPAEQSSLRETGADVGIETQSDIAAFNG